MTEPELVTLVHQIPGLELHRPDAYPEELVAQKGGTLVLLTMEDSLLSRYRVSWISGFTKRSSGLIHDVCSGSKYVELYFLGNKAVAGAMVWLDGEAVAQVDKDGDFMLDVPLGVHELRIEQPGSGTWVTELHYDETSSGYDRLPFELLIKQE